MFSFSGQHIGGHRDHRQLGMARIGSQPPSRRVTVQHRHLQIHQYDIESAGIGSDLVQRFLAIVGHPHQQSSLTQNIPGHFLIDGLILHQQHPSPTQLSRFFKRADRPLGGFRLGRFGVAESGGKTKDAALAQGAGHFDPSTHHFHQPLADRQA